MASLVTALAGLVLGVPCLLVGYVFVDEPERGFRIYHGGGVEPDADPLTESGRWHYQLRGLLIMAIGVAIVLIGVFA